MDQITIIQQLDSLYKQVDMVLEIYYKTKAAYESKADQQKTMLAAISMKYEGSEAYIKRAAEGDKLYKEFIDELAVARSKYLQAWSNWEAIETKISILQSSAKLFLQTNQ